MTPEEKERCLKVLKKASIIAARRGNDIVDDCGGDTAISTASAAIILSTLAAASGMSTHDVMSLLMSVHKETERLVKERT